MTAATPMIMPSEVSAERSLLRVIASSASPIVLLNLHDRLPCLAVRRHCRFAGTSRHLRHQRRAARQPALAASVFSDRATPVMMLRAFGQAVRDRSRRSRHPRRQPARGSAGDVRRTSGQIACARRRRLGRRSGDRHAAAEFFQQFLARRESQRRCRHAQHVVRARGFDRHGRRHAGLQCPSSLGTSIIVV